MGRPRKYACEDANERLKMSMKLYRKNNPELIHDLSSKAFIRILNDPIRHEKEKARKRNVYYVQKELKAFLAILLD